MSEDLSRRVDPDEPGTCSGGDGFEPLYVRSATTATSLTAVCAHSGPHATHERDRPPLG